MRRGGAWPFAAWGGRRIGASMAAAVLAGLLVGSTAFAASRAGGPLYEPRLSLEALTLPSDPTQRLDAELARAQTRIAEIAEAASRGDDGAIDAAVHAYAQTLGDIDASTGESAGRARDAVILHQAVLRNLLLRVPIQAQSGIERAISNSSVAIDVLDKASAKPAATPLGPANGNPNAGGGNPNAGAGGPNAGAGGPDAGGGDPNGGGGNGGGNPNGGGGNGGGGNGGGNPNGGGGNGGGDGGDDNAGAEKTPKPDGTKERHGQGPAPSD